MSASDSARAVELSRKSALAANVLMNTVCAPRLLEMVDTNSPETGQTFHEECLKGVARADVVVGFTDQGIEPSRLRFEFLSLQTSRHFDLESLRMPPSADELPVQGSYTMTLAAQYCGYYSCMARTILVDPPETVKTAYSIAEKVHLSTIKSLTDGAVLKDVYLGAKQKVLAEAPQLAPLFIKSMGFVIKGRELKDTSLEITETCHGKVHAGMVVFVSTGFGTQASEAEQQEKSSERQWALRIGDTVIVKNSNTHEVPTHDSSKHPGVIFEIGSELEQEASPSAVKAEDGAAGTPSSATEKPGAATEKPAAAATRKRKGPDGEATAEAEAAKAKVRAEEKEAKAAAKQLSDEAKAKARAEAKEAKKKAKEEAKAKAREEAQEAKAKARAEAQAAKADGKVAPKRVPASPVPCKERSTNQATPNGDAMQNGEKEAKGPAETDDKAKQSSKRRRLVSTEVAYEQRERARACDRENVEIKDSDEEDEERRKSSEQQESMKDKREEDQAGEGQIGEEKDEEEEGDEEPEHDKEEAKHHADKAAASGGAQARDKAKASKPPRRVVSRKRRRRAKRPSGAAAAAASAAEAEVKTHSTQEVRTAMANSMLMGCMLGLAMSKCFDSLLQPTR